MVHSIGFPNQPLVTGQASNGDNYMGPGSSRKNWSATWCAGAPWSMESDYGSIGDGTPSGFTHATSYACIWNHKMAVTASTSRRVGPLNVELLGGAGTLMSRGNRYTITANDLPVRLLGELAAAPEIRLAVLGDYNKNGKIEWCDAAAWMRDLGVSRLTMPANYTETLIYKLYLDNISWTKPQRTFEDCLDVIRKLHSLSGGLRQIVYLVGWQDRGHDTAYPGMGPINQRLGGPDGLDKLVGESLKYNCTISVHTNFDDAYEGNPRFDPAVLSRDPDGSLHLWFTNHEVAERKVYSINHTLAMQSGYHKDQMEELLGNIPVENSIHLDAHRAFNTVWQPDGTCLDAECECQLGIERLRLLFAERGIDVTNEFASFGPHGGSIWGVHAHGHTDLFAAVMCHGIVRSLGRNTPENEGLGRDFIWGEHEFLTWKQAAERFFTHWMYSQLLARKEMLDYKVGEWNEGVEAWYRDDTYVRTGRAGAVPTKLYATYEGIPIARDRDRFLPWRDNLIYVYSQAGGTQQWTLPEGWEGTSISLDVLSEQGTFPGPIFTITGRTVTFYTAPGVPYCLRRD
ncbi:MAG: endo-alpha-N-acetylgalactosaminidase family protein [Verrucomicrobiota bacterium]|nr:endo-alpha-N-acetylgalactosaminidase family protein [Verrucomicrobiota bacterium]